ncbi:MAG: preprotein translocase subunit SecG [Flavobacteriaceae bacterium]|nr:preprotein translocase subunit SecG [Flavobacteriaceae bacterium]
MTYTLFLVLIMIVAVLLILIIMVQNPKGGGLSSSFGGGQALGGGVQSTNNFLDKSTWTLSITLLALILLSSFAAPRADQNDNSEVQKMIENRQAPAKQSAPAEVPATPATPEKK